MAITGIPTFEDGEIPPAAKLNLLGSAISTKFGGAIGPADMSWPMVVEGNIDFDQSWAIVGLRTFWNIVNAAEYDTLDDAVTAAEAAGGTAVLIPPDTTIPGDGVDIDTSGITIMGCGHTSVIQMTTGSSGYILRTGSGSLSDITIENLTLDGNSAGSTELGVQVRRVTGFTMRNVLMKNFTGSALQITHGGTPGNSSVDAKILGCRFKDGTGAHIEIVDVDGLIIADTKSDGCAVIAIEMEPESSSGLLKRITLSAIDVDEPVGVGVSILGASATADDNWSMITLRGVTVTGAFSDGFNIGLATKLLKYVSMVGCSAPNVIRDALRLAVSDSHISNNFLRDAGEDGIDLLTTETTVIAGNDVLGAGSLAISPATAVSLGNRISGNHGYASLTDGALLVMDVTSYSLAAGAEGDSGFLYTIPANTVHIGAMVRIRIDWDCAGGGSPTTTTFTLEIGGVAMFATTHGGQTVTHGRTECDFKVVAMTGASNTVGVCAWYLLLATGAGTIGGDRTVDQIDWTVDNDVTVDFTAQGASDDTTLHAISIEILGAS